ncbi:MAG: hypothetical protein H6Q89_3525 [Myxococcaceae bacterium]|nr:hypothetical protein [Myxococcaceae bacterium]
MTHPSFLKLDRHALGVDVPEVATHLAGCPQCSAHVARILQPAPVPHSLAAAVRPVRSGRSLLGWLLAPAALVAAALLVLLPGTPEVRSKGAPALAVFVRHAEQVSRWDGKTPLSAGDAVRLEVAPSQFPYVTVLQPGAPEAKVLYEGEVQAQGTVLLPPSWTLDGAPGPERLTVVFSHAALSPTQRDQLAEVPRTPHLWTLPLLLPKESPR